jgi:dynein heavy chain
MEWEEQNKALMKQVKEIKVDRKSNVFGGINTLIKNWSIFLPLVSQLKEESMRDRHWDLLKEAVGKQFKLDDTLKLQFIYDLNLPRYGEQVEEITDQARQEAKMEKTLEGLGKTWDVIPFDMA